MIRTALSGLITRLRSWWAVENPEDRIEGSGDVTLDPAYNGRYTAERNLQALSMASEEEDASIGRTESETDG